MRSIRSKQSQFLSCLEFNQVVDIQVGSFSLELEDVAQIF
jgi:hypothetical protein